jgi:hypothetical protein
MRGIANSGAMLLNQKFREPIEKRDFLKKWAPGSGGGTNCINRVRGVAR